MKMRSFIILFAFACVSAAGYVLKPSYTRTPLGDSIDVSTMKILRETFESSADKNIVSSPLGVMILLSLFNRGAGPAAKSEIIQFLGGSVDKPICQSYENLSVMFSEMDPGYFSIANQVSVSDQYNLNENFAAAANNYRCEFGKLDFSKPEEAAAKINQWASDKTKGHITSPVSDGTLRDDTVAALFNVIYFNGHWHVPFKAEETKEKNFHVSRDSVVKKPMMHLLKPLYYTDCKELGAKMIELPYKEDGFRMVVLLPNEIDGLPAVLGKAAEMGILADVFKLDDIGRNVLLDMPKFEIRTKLNFNDILPKVGVSSLFGEGAAGIVQNEPVKVDKVFQEAFIKVNEEGATAGAFTGVVMVPYSEYSTPPPPIKFSVDHPFLYAILYEDKIIFAGTYTS